ncbi:MAG: ABC transporter substrate-binding protein [Xanthomonadales bacterium]|nr:ABC transporter substrate-binding protein [Xanthomonadales bacterium]
MQLCLLALLAVLARPATGIQLEQSDGGNLELDTPATRLVTLAPNLAELVYAAGAGAYLAGTVEYSDFPEAARAVPRVGDAFRFDLERILALEPDLVLAWASGNPAPALLRLESLGFTVWRIEVRHPRDMAALLRQIAIATGLDDNGVADAVLHRLDQLEQAYAGQPPVRYFYQVAERPLFTLNGEHVVSRGLALCGGHNVFADQPVLAPQVSREAVLQANPAVMLAPRLNADDTPLEHWRDWPQLQAVQADAFVYLDANRISRATPRMLDSLETGCKLMHRFRNLN